MSIFKQTRRPVKPYRNRPRGRQPFALGLETESHSFIRYYAADGRQACIVEDGLWYERPDPTARYGLYLTLASGMTRIESYDSLPEADLAARLFVSPLPPLTDDETAWVANETFVRECLDPAAALKAAASSFESPMGDKQALMGLAPISGGAPVHGPEDETWWAEHQDDEPEMFSYDDLYAESLRADDPEMGSAWGGHDLD